MNCFTCKMNKIDSEFPWKNREDGVRSGMCKGCHRTYSREHYLRNKDSYRRKATKHRTELLAKNRQLISDHLSSHPCVDCGETDIVVLDFDHIAGKSFSIGRSYGKVTTAVLSAEIAKCEVRCANCHRRRHSTSGSWWRSRV